MAPGRVVGSLGQRGDASPSNGMLAAPVMLTNSVDEHTQAPTVRAATTQATSFQAQTSQAVNIPQRGGSHATTPPHIEHDRRALHASPPHIGEMGGTNVQVGFYPGPRLADTAQAGRRAEETEQASPLSGPEEQFARQIVRTRRASRAPAPREEERSTPPPVKVVEVPVEKIVTNEKLVEVEKQVIIEKVVEVTKWKGEDKISPAACGKDILFPTPAEEHLSAILTFLRTL